MLRWILLCYFIAAALAVVGFNSLAGTASVMAQILFALFSFVPLAVLVFRHGLADT